jgi:hypothetical protein
MQKRKAKGHKEDPAQQLLLQRLKELAEKTGVAVREERLVREVGYHVRSGACRLHGQDVLLLDTGASPAERIEALLEFLGGCDLEGVFVEPDLRRLIHGHSVDEAQTA